MPALLSLINAATHSQCSAGLATTCAAFSVGVRRCGGEACGRLHEVAPLEWAPVHGGGEREGREDALHLQQLPATALLPVCWVARGVVQLRANASAGRGADLHSRSKS